MIDVQGRLPVTSKTSADCGGKRVQNAIAKGAFRSGGSNGPIQVRAQVLREWQASAGAGATLGFVLPDHAPPPPCNEAGGAQWRQSDVRRAITAAEKAGLHDYRVEIAPDGTIAIVVGGPAEVPDNPRP